MHALSPFKGAHNLFTALIMRAKISRRAIAVSRHQFVLCKSKRKKVAILSANYCRCQMRVPKIEKRSVLDKATAISGKRQEMDSELACSTPSTTKPTLHYVPVHVHGSRVARGSIPPTAASFLFSLTPLCSDTLPHISAIASKYSSSLRF